MDHLPPICCLIFFLTWGSIFLFIGKEIQKSPDFYTPTIFSYKLEIPWCFVPILWGLIIGTEFEIIGRILK